MPLNYDFTDIEGWEEFHREENELALSSILALHMMSIGMRSITENNWKEVYRRMHIFEHAIYTVASRNVNIPGEKPFTEPYYYTPMDIQRRIGLRTNASVMSKAKFKEHIMSQLSHNAMVELTIWRDRQ